MKFLLLLFLATMLNSELGAELISPREKPASIETNHFTIIFPSKIRSTAEYLASFADAVYLEICGHLETKPRFKRLPVVISTKSEEINGYYTGYPYNRIVLYQAAVDTASGLSSFNNDLYKLFYHELTHAVSLSSSGPFQRVFSAIFGQPASLVYARTPYNMIEGVTVAFESLDGFGRASDPFAGASLRQDILEGRWKGFYQTGGAYNDWPGGNLYYLYGGYFSSMLIQRYGMAKYAELWRRNNSDNLLKGLDRFLFVNGHFYDTYGMTIEQAWKELERAMTIRVPVYMAVDRLRGPGLFTALTASTDWLFYAVALENKVFARNLHSGHEVPLFDAGASISRLSWNETRERLLISTTRTVEGFQQLELRIWDGQTKRQSVIPVRSLRDAVWATPSAIVAIQVDGYQTNLVWLGDGGEPELLLAGNENTSYSSPVVSPDRDSIYVLVRENGVQAILRLEGVSLGSGTQRHIKASKLAMPSGLKRIRYLSITPEGKLLASWDDDKLPRLVEIDTKQETIAWQQVPLSGGVHQAVAQRGSIYYLGSFSEGLVLARLPEDRSMLDFQTDRLSWSEADHLLRSQSSYSRPPSLETGRYTPVFWLLPRFWHPTLSYDSSRFTTGAVLYLADPVERLSADVAVDWNFDTSTPGIRLNFQFNGLPPTLNLTVLDEFIQMSDQEGTASILRLSRAGIAASYNRNTFSNGNYGGVVSLGLLGANRTLPEQTAYAGWSEIAGTAGISFVAGKFRRSLAEPDARAGIGTDINLDGRFGVKPDNSILLQASSGISLDLKPLAMQNRLRVNYSARFIDGGGSLDAKYSWDSGSWRLSADSSIQPLKAQLQQRFGLVYFNHLFLRLGSANTLSSDSLSPFSVRPEFDSSLYSRLSLTWSPLIGTAAALLRFSTTLEFRYNILNDAFGFAFNLAGLF